MKSCHRSHQWLCVAFFLVVFFSGCGSESSSFTFAVLGDTRGPFFVPAVDSKHFPGMVSAVSGLDPLPDLVLFTGDAMFYADGLSWNRWFDIMAPIFAAGIPVYPTLGNHEVLLDHKYRKVGMFKDRFPGNPGNGPKGPSFDYTGLTFSFDHGNVHFVCLTSNLDSKGGIDDEQIEWLATDLAQNQNDFVVLLYHMPAYPTGAHMGQSLDRDPAQRDKLWQVIDAADVDLVINGHEHNYSRWTIGANVNPRWTNDVLQVVSGGGGAPLDDENKTNPDVFIADYEYMVIDVSDERMNCRAMNENGELIDQFAIE